MSLCPLEKLENVVALTVSAELQKAVPYKGLQHVSAFPSPWDGGGGFQIHSLPGNCLSPLWLICIFEAAISEIIVDFLMFGLLRYLVIENLHLGWKNGWLDLQDSF